MRRDIMRNAAPGSKKRKVGTRDEVQPSSGNVFADLELPDAEGYLAKAELARRICALIGERRLTQAKAAALLWRGPTQGVGLDAGQARRLFHRLSLR
jgi:hypothetical protein